MIFLTISAIGRRLIRLCSSLCSSSPNLRSSVHLDGGFAHHRLVNDGIATIDLLRLLARHRHRYGPGYAVPLEIPDRRSPEVVRHARDAGGPNGALPGLVKPAVAETLADSSTSISSAFASGDT
jgi:hypothetical protein